MYIRKLEGTWFLMKGNDMVDSFDTRKEAEWALFDAKRTWKCLADKEMA